MKKARGRKINAQVAYVNSCSRNNMFLLFGGVVLRRVVVFDHLEGEVECTSRTCVRSRGAVRANARRDAYN